jgi:hypothetical protein
MKVIALTICGSTTNWIFTKPKFLSAYSTILNWQGHLPRPFGVFYRNERPCYEDQMKLQIENAKASKPGDLDKLLKGKEVWTIN